MKGIPKHLNTKFDYEYIRKTFCNISVRYAVTSPYNRPFSSLVKGLLSSLGRGMLTRLISTLLIN